MSTFTTALEKTRNYFRLPDAAEAEPLQRVRVFLLTWMVSVLALTIFIVFDSVNLAIFQSTVEGRIIAVNPEFARRFIFASSEDVTDNGVGLPQDFDFRSSGRTGAQNVLLLVEHQLGCQVSVDSGPSGVAWRIEFRDDQYHAQV